MTYTEGGIYEPKMYIINYLKLHNLSEMIHFRLDDVEAHIYFGDHLVTDLLSYRNKNQDSYDDTIEEDLILQLRSGKRIIH